MQCVNNYITRISNNLPFGKSERIIVVPKQSRRTQMSIMNSIITANLTHEEQVELQRLNDEVDQATDELKFADDKYTENNNYSLHQELQEDFYICRRTLELVISNLNNYKQNISEAVLSRMKISQDAA